MKPIYLYYTDIQMYDTYITLKNQYHIDIPIPISPISLIPIQIQIQIFGDCFIQIPIHDDIFVYRYRYWVTLSVYRLIPAIGGTLLTITLYKIRDITSRLRKLNPKNTRLK